MLTGVQVPCLDREKKWPFTPSKDFKVGDLVSGGDIYGTVYENTLITEHRIMVHPKVGSFPEPVSHDCLRSRLWHGIHIPP